MKHLRLIHLTSVAELRAAAPDWDDLWWRSDVALPTMRAELLAQWVEQFRPRAAFHAIAVADAGHWLAAMPLIADRVCSILPVGSLPNNPWVASGDLLLDSTAEADSTTELLAAAVADLPWPLLWLNEVSPEATRWQSFLRASERADVAIDYRERYRVGRIEIQRTWDAFEKRLSRSHRQAMRRMSRRLACEGEVRFERRSQWAPDEVEPSLQAAFDVENRSWKGEAGTSILHTPGMFRYFVNQAKQLAAWGQLDMATLRLNDQVIAFVYGACAKHTLFAYKISYDPGFASFSPGQLLFHSLFEHMHQEGGVQTLDFLGPITQATSRWHPTTYGIGRAVLAPNRLLSRAAFHAYHCWWRPLRSRTEPLPCPASPPSLNDSTTIEPISAAR